MNKPCYSYSVPPVYDLDILQSSPPKSVTQGSLRHLSSLEPFEQGNNLLQININNMSSASIPAAKSSIGSSSSTTSDTKPTTTTLYPLLVDTGKLRIALRLVHCIQKERGSSCAYYANHALFESAMYQARKASDVSAKDMLLYSDLPVASSLSKIRSLLIDDEEKRSSSHDLIYHRIFVCFNTLVSSLVHECVLKNLEGSLRNSTTKKDNNKPSTKTKKKNGQHRRHLSSEINNHLASYDPVGLATPERRNNFRKTFVFDGSEEAREKFNLTELENPDASTAPVVVTAPVNKHEDNARADTTEPNVQKPSASEQEVQQLLDLLHLFVQLKESAGVERAILSSLLAFRNCSSSSSEDENSNNSVPSFRMLTNDLILEVENQRALCHKLERLPSGPHHSLVLELAQLSPRLEELHQIILTDFESLMGAEYDPESIFDLITLYMDKLHSVELLIIEDLDLACSEHMDSVVQHKNNTTSLPMRRIASLQQIAQQQQQQQKQLPTQTEDQDSSSSDALVDRALEQIGNSTEENVSFELIANIKKMPAEELKERVLALLSGTGANQSSARGQGSKSSVSKSVSVYARSSAAEILNQDMNEALHKPWVRAESDKEWEISIYEIKFTKRLGQGASATTYLGKWTGQNVAVKVASITEFGLEGWRTEVNALQRLHHPNIIRLMGSIYNENPQTHCLVLEYCNAGDLASALRYPTPRNFFFHVSSSIANAMSYLHKRGIMHRDLKPSNVLCDGNIASGKFVVKITDFGIATDISRINSDEGSQEDRNGKHKLTGETGTYRWMSPEVIRHQPYNSTADVYSFAVMMWQFVTHDEPFATISSVEAAKAVAIEKKRPPMHKMTPVAIVELIESNWDDDATKRWDFDRIAETIQSVQDNMSQEDHEWLEEPDGHPVYGCENLEDMEPMLQEVFAAQPGDAVSGVARRGSEKGSSLGNKILGRSPGSGLGRSPGPGRPHLPKKGSLLSSFFRKTSFDR